MNSSHFDFWDTMRLCIIPGRLSADPGIVCSNQIEGYRIVSRIAKIYQQDASTSSPLLRIASEEWWVLYPHFSIASEVQESELTYSSICVDDLEGIIWVMRKRRGIGAVRV
jgi:hypothetical protein